jgi:hypothetical protein
MERFYSLDIKTQYVLQDSVRKDTFKSITTVEGVQWLMWTFYHWGIKYLTYDTVSGLQLYHGRPVYDVNTKRWYGTKVITTDNNTTGTSGEVNTGDGDIHGNTVIDSSVHRGNSDVERRDITNEVHTDILPMDNRNGEDLERGNRGNTNDNGHGSNNHSVGDGINTHGNDREVVNADTHSVSSDGGVQSTVLGASEVVDYTDKGNEPKGLSFYLHSLISSVFELSDGMAIELTTQALEEGNVEKALTDGTIVEVSNNGITWFKRYFKSIEPNLSTKYCVYGGGRTKDTVRDMADVEYYQYMRYTNTTQSNTNTCNSGCGSCNNTTVKYEGVRNTVDGRVVFADRGSLDK